MGGVRKLGLDGDSLGVLRLLAEVGRKGLRLSREASEGGGARRREDCCFCNSARSA